MSNYVRFCVLFFSLIAFTQGRCFSDECYNECGGSLPFVGEINISYDDFHGIPDGTWNGNTGALIGGNFGFYAFDLFGVQAGGSYGVYDWYGRGPAIPEISGGVQQQGFITAGLYRRAPCSCGIQGGIVVDWMFNKNFGVFALDPNCGQVRMQLGYLWEGTDEFGVWGTVNLETNHKTVFEIPVEFRAISQVSLFWRHIFENCAETFVWAGLPCNESLMFHKKRAGQFLVGANFRVPLTENFCIEGHGVYMGSSGRNEFTRFQNYDANICIGLTYAFSAGTFSYDEVRLASPYMPIANNSNFLIDTSLND